MENVIAFLPRTKAAAVRPRDRRAGIVLRHTDIYAIADISSANSRKCAPLLDFRWLDDRGSFRRLSNPPSRAIAQRVVKDVSFSTIFAGVLPFITTDIVRLIILIAFPILATYLPSHM